MKDKKQKHSFSHRISQNAELDNLKALDLENVIEITRKFMQLYGLVYLNPSSLKAFCLGHSEKLIGLTRVLMYFLTVNPSSNRSLMHFCA